MAPKLYKAAEVCELAQLQPYVLRSWEKEFPGIGVQKSPNSPRFYRQSDLDQVLRIKELVFRDGLTLAGARRRLEDEAPVPGGAAQQDGGETLYPLGASATAAIAEVREGLRLVLEVLSQSPGGPGVARLTRREGGRLAAPSGAKAESSGLAGRIGPTGVRRGDVREVRRKDGGADPDREGRPVGLAEEEFQLRPSTQPAPPSGAQERVQPIAPQKQAQEVSKAGPGERSAGQKRKRANA